MQELLLAVARGLVEDKEAVQVTVDPMREDGTVVYHLKVAEADMGRVIGKQGRIAKAIRVVVRAAASVRARKSSLRSTKTRYKALCRRVKCFFQCRGEHCSPAAALRQRRLPRVDAVLHRRADSILARGVSAAANRPLQHIRRNYAKLSSRLQDRVHPRRARRNESPAALRRAAFLAKFKRLFTTADGAGETRVLGVRAQGNVILLRLDGVNDMDAARAQVGRVYYLAKADARLPKGRFFIDDLLDCEVVDAETGHVYGRLTNVDRPAAQDIYTVTDTAGGEHMLPAVPEFVKNIDIEARKFW